jgi:hypothetical protein
MSHRCEIVYAKSIDKYQIKCLECGALLCDDVTTLPEFSAPGDCEIPETLGIHVEEKIRTEDIFGGV